MKKIITTILIFISALTIFAAGHTVTITSANASCYGGYDGFATAVVSGGIGPFSYSWSNSSTSATISGVIGSYTCTVTDNNDLSTATASVNITQPPQKIFITVVTKNATCGADGSAIASVAGGKAPYAYVWSPGGQTSTTATIAGLSSSCYTLNVTDADYCPSWYSFCVGGPPQNKLVTTSFNSTCGQSNGSAFVTSTGGTAPYTYFWSPSNKTTATVKGLSSGSYSVTATDVNGCTASSAVVVTNVSGPFVSITTTDAACGQNNGTATASAFGASGVFTYSWSNGSVGIVNTGLSAGTYIVTVSDGTGCTATSIAGISDIGSPNVVVSAQYASCQAVTNGGALAVVTAGTAPYTFLWSTGSTNDTIFNLKKGNYVLTLTDGAGCKAVKLVSIGVPGGAIHFNIRQIQHNNCGSCTATAKLENLDGGLAPYTYKWSSLGITSDSAYALCSGSYTVTVTDVAGCTASGMIYIGSYNDNALSGRVYNDKNANCIYDAGDVPLKNLIVDGYNATITDSNGVYTIYNIPTSNFNVSVNSLPTKWSKHNCPSTGNYSVNFPASCDTISNKDFAILVPSNVQDMSTALYTGIARPGFEQWNQVCYYNEGTKIMNATVRVTHDSDLVFKSAIPVQSSYTYPVLEWNFTNLAPGASSCISFTMETPTTKPIGTQLITKAEVFPITGDTAQENNTAIDTRNVQGSYDPNLKEVQPNGNISPTDTVLKYTIHFQNTGNDTAFNITVKDTLPVYLNPATIKIGASSHYCRTQLFNNVLVFAFPNILLVDSMRNEPKSHGWVSFAIHSKPGIPVGTVIENEADIYFDFNEPITTNIASSKIVVIDDSTLGDSSGDFKIHPNPAADKIYLLYKSTITAQKVLSVEMFNVLGSKVRSQQNIYSGLNEISLEGLTRGLYLLQIKDSENKVVDVERVVVE